MTPEQENTHKLNALFRSMGQRGKEGEIWKEHTEHRLVYMLREASKFLSRNGNNSMTFQAYGSAVEDLKSMAPTDAGDLDIIITSSSDALIIQDEMIEYSENPVYVRIKAVGHKNLRSCLVEDTQYLASSALENFHPAIYGKSAPHLIKTLIQTLQIFSEEQCKIAFEWRNKDACPALQIDYKQCFGAVSGEVERLNNPNTSINVDVADWEWFAHALCSSRGIEYSKQHASVIKEYFDHAKEVQRSFREKGLLAKPETFPLLLQELAFSDRVRNLKERVREIESRMENESGRREEFASSREAQQKDSQVAEKCDEKKSGGGNDGRSLTTPFLEYEGEKSECPSLQTAIDPTIEEPSGCSENEMPKLTTEITKGEKHVINKNKSEDEGLMNEEIPILKPNEEQQNPGSTVPEDPFIEADPQKGEEDLKTLLSQTDHFFQHFFCQSKAEATNTEQDPKEQQTPNNTPVTPIVGGFDLVPALKCSGWPKVAMEWIKRERNWPSPDIVAKVVNEGFHLVVKSPKKAITPECDFRLSFSHAEYLLSQEMNDTQRDCYRCLKTFHRGYLKIEAEISSSSEEAKSLMKTTEMSKGLVTFHLKNIFLKTIESTDPEMWNDDNRTECMRMLFGNLLEALIQRDLRHYFVDSYNLFGADYIDNPEILDCLAEKVVKIIDDPEGVAKCIEEKEKKLQKGDNAGKGSGDGQSFPPGVAKKEQGKSPMLAISPGMAAAQGSSGYRYHDLRDTYLAIGQELIGMAFNEDPLLDVPDTERRLVEDLRELIVKHKMTAENFSKVFKSFWSLAYYKVGHHFYCKTKRDSLIFTWMIGGHCFKEITKENIWATNMAAVMSCENQRSTQSVWTSVTKHGVTFSKNLILRFGITRSLDRSKFTKRKH